MLRSNSYGGSRSIFSLSVDWVMILLYVGLVLIGWMSICSASYDETAIDPYSFSHFYVKQVLWIGLSLVVALVVMLLDDKYYHMLAYPAYIGGLLVLIGTLLFGKEVNGAKAWIEFGFFSLQPVELVKIATALALARVMSSYSFSITRFGDLMRVATIILLPLLIIILQNDTGSGIVLCSFIFVLYREGLNKWLCIPFILIAALFIGSLILTPMTMLVLLILLCTIFEVLMNGEWPVSSATAGVVAFALFNNGEQIPGTLMSETITAVNDFANIGIAPRRVSHFPVAGVEHPTGRVVGGIFNAVY